MFSHYVDIASIINGIFIWFLVSMGFFDDIFISHERLKDPSRLYPFVVTYTNSFVSVGKLAFW